MRRKRALGVNSDRFDQGIAHAHRTVIGSATGHGLEHVSIASVGGNRRDMRRKSNDRAIDVGDRIGQRRLRRNGRLLSHRQGYKDLKQAKRCSMSYTPDIQFPNGL